MPHDASSAADQIEPSAPLDREAPPTEPFDPNRVVFVDPPRWPGIIGWISTIWAGLTLTCMGLGTLWVMVFMHRFIPPEMNDPTVPVLNISSLQLVQAALGLFHTILLLSAGIMLIRRHALGRTLHLTYAVTAFPLIVLGMVAGVLQSAAMNAWVKDHPTSPWAQQHSPAGQWIGLVIGIVIGGAYPLFCFIWFVMIKPRSEDMLAPTSPDSEASVG